MAVGLKLHEEAPKDRGTRSMASKLALRGHGVGSGVVYDQTKPYCDEPLFIHRAVRAGGLKRSLEVSAWRPCRRCPKCLQFRQLKWKERCDLELAKSVRTWFVTLTFSPIHLAGVLFEAQRSGCSDHERAVGDAAYKHVQAYLKRLRKRARTKFRFVAVYERGEEKGRSHFHLFIHELPGQRPVHKATIERCWRSIVHARLVVRDKRGLSSYITKYTTKSLAVRPRASVRYGQ